jgi:hypothetical protein
MKRPIAWSAAALIAVLAVPPLHADAKTQTQTTFKLAGLMGRFLSHMIGGSEGVTSTEAVKGNRMSRINDRTGRIVDLDEQKVYTLDMKKKQYSVQTFAELRQQLEQEKAQVAKQSAESAPQQTEQAPPPEQVEFDANLKETGQHKTIAGYDTHEVILTITMRQKGQTLEQGGGLVMTETVWVGPHIAALDELRQFELRYFNAVYGQTFSGMDLQQMNAVSAMVPGAAAIGQHLATEGGKLQGSPLATTVVMERVKSQAEMQQAGASDSGGGGLGGLLARRLHRSQGEARSTVLTTTNETLSVGTSVSADDLAIPAGFKEKPAK